MNNLAFIASVVGSLAVPVTVLVVMLVFRGPLAELLGRIISYEGLGQKVNFGQKLADAEKSVSEAVAQAQQSTGQTQLSTADAEKVAGSALLKITSPERNPHDIDLRRAGLVELAELATSNPSFVVIKAWEELEATLSELVEAAFPNARLVSPSLALPDLIKKQHVDTSFADAVRELRGLRNDVAHGQHNPTAGEAVTYQESARDLGRIAARTAVTIREKRAILEKIDQIRATLPSDHVSE